ncbi:MAG: hypothetical protein HY892_19455 [Deltaproteobacteria bacterium]|nr:hypothetical protein [Deltaproteobacteria bacterium]
MISGDFDTGDTEGHGNHGKDFTVKARREGAPQRRRGRGEERIWFYFFGEVTEKAKKSSLREFKGRIFSRGHTRTKIDERRRKDLHRKGAKGAKRRITAEAERREFGFDFSDKDSKKQKNLLT